MDYEEAPGGDGHARYYELAPDLWFPAKVHAEGPAPGVDPRGTMLHDGRAVQVSATYQLSPMLSHYSMVSIRLHAIAENPRYRAGLISPATFRAVRLADIQTGIDALAKSTDEMPRGDFIVVPLPSLPPRRHRKLDEKLVATAHAYARGVLNGRRGQKAVSEELGVSIATAGRRVKAAKEAGYLLPSLGTMSDDDASSP